jgi:hypothetical protein
MVKAQARPREPGGDGQLFRGSTAARLRVARVRSSACIPPARGMSVTG